MRSAECNIQMYYRIVYLTCMMLLTNVILMYLIKFKKENNINCLQAVCLERRTLGLIRPNEKQYSNREKNPQSFCHLRELTNLSAFILKHFSKQTLAQFVSQSDPESESDFIDLLYSSVLMPPLIKQLRLCGRNIIK